MAVFTWESKSPIAVTKSTPSAHPMALRLVVITGYEMAEFYEFTDYDSGPVDTSNLPEIPWSVYYSSPENTMNAIRKYSLPVTAEDLGHLLALIL
jgi:hypothetical protein